MQLIYKCLLFKMFYCNMHVHTKIKKCILTVTVSNLFQFHVELLENRFSLTYIKGINKVSSIVRI